MGEFTEEVDATVAIPFAIPAATSRLAVLELVLRLAIAANRGRTPS